MDITDYKSPSLFKKKKMGKVVFFPRLEIRVFLLVLLGDFVVTSLTHSTLGMEPQTSWPEVRCSNPHMLSMSLNVCVKYLLMWVSFCLSTSDMNLLIHGMFCAWTYVWWGRWALASEECSVSRVNKCLFFIFFFRLCCTDIVFHLYHFSFTAGYRFVLHRLVLIF